MKEKIEDGTGFWKGSGGGNRNVWRLPPAILNATGEYRGEMDVIGNFLKECYIQKPEASIRIRELFKAYQGWCEENNEQHRKRTVFGLHLKEMGIEQGRTSEARFWCGLGLLSNIDFIGPKEFACAREVLLLLSKHAQCFACIIWRGLALRVI
jgi:phage/plasmid-associated DNA primase